MSRMTLKKSFPLSKKPRDRGKLNLPKSY